MIATRASSGSRPIDSGGRDLGQIGDTVRHVETCAQVVPAKNLRPSTKPNSTKRTLVAHVLYEICGVVRRLTMVDLGSGFGETPRQHHDVGKLLLSHK